MTGILQALLMGRGAAAAATDADFEYVTMLLPGNGTNGAQNNTFLDSSSNNFTITRNGNTTQGTFTPYGDNWSNYFDGTGDNLSLTGVTAVGNSNATVEFFIFPTDSSLTYRSVFDSRSTVNTDTGFGIFQYGLTIEVYGNGLKVSSAASALTINQWNHVAITRSSGTCQLYINGSTSGSSATYSSNLTSTAVRIADSVNTLFPYVGYISNLRVVVGSVVYSGSTYTVPTAPLTAITNTSLLTCQSNRFIDNSTNAFTITRNGDVSVQRFSPFSPTAAYASGTIGGSGYFDGTGDSLEIADNTAFTLDGDFTIEGWLYPFSVADSDNFIAKWQPSNQEYLFWPESGVPKFYWAPNSAVTALLTSSVSIPTNAWTHLAVTRSGNSFTMWVNGVSRATATNSSAVTNTSSPVEIGRLSQYPPNYDYQGYMAGVRIVKGTAVYTAAFTPPTSPVTAITNTSLLCNFTNAGIIDNAMMNDLETVGNAQISTTQSKFGGSSMYFDGTGDYLVSNTATPDLYAFGTGNFTIEFWVRYANTTGVQVLYDGRPSGTQGAYPTIYSNGGSLRYYTNTSDQITGSTLSANVWYHIAVSRSGTSTKLFIDGTQSGSTYTDSTNYLGAAGRPSIGDGFTLGSYSFNGYIDDLRVTKGIARYTANFTAPTAAFPTS